MSKKQKYSRRPIAEWRTLIESFDQSGLSTTRFCKLQGIAVSSFYQWRARFADESLDQVISESVPSSFIDLSDLPSASGGWWTVLKLGNGVELSLNQV